MAAHIPYLVDELDKLNIPVMALSSSEVIEDEDAKHIVDDLDSRERQVSLSERRPLSEAQSFYKKYGLEALQKLRAQGSIK